MLETMKDGSGNIIAVCEWLLFDKDAKYVDTGDSVYIDCLEKNVGVDGKHVIQYFIREIYKKAPQIKDVYFYREPKHPGRGFVRYDVKRVLRRAV